MKILIVKMSAIGDVLHTLPVIAYLQTRFPSAEIDWVVEKSSFDLLVSHPNLHRVFLADIKEWRKNLFKKASWKSIKHFYSELRRVEYDLLFDLQGNSKSALITYCAKAKIKVGFGWKTLAEKPNYLVTHKRYEVARSLSVRSRYLGLLSAYFQEVPDKVERGFTFYLKPEEEVLLNNLSSHPLMAHKPRFMVAFGSHWKNKRLNEGILKAFLQSIHKRYQPAFFFPFGNKEEALLAEELHQLFPNNSLIIGKLSLQLWQAFMGKMEGVISMDSAALHLCATTLTPSFSFFGPSASSVFKPEGNQHAAYQGACPYGRTFEERCPILRTCPSGACLQQAPLDLILTQFDNWWKSLFEIG